MFKNLLNNITKDGNVRTHKTCPFASKCSQKTAECPTRGKTKPKQHACGMARLFTQSEKHRRTLPVLQPPTPPQPQLIGTWNLAEAVKTKVAERFSGQAWIPQAEINRF